MLAVLSNNKAKIDTPPQHRFNRLQKPWTMVDGLVCLYLTITTPLAISMWLLVAKQKGWLSHSVYSFLNGNSILASVLGLIIGLMVELGLLYYFYKRYHLSIASFGITKFSGKKAIVYILVFYVSFVVLVYLTYLLLTLFAPQINLDESQKIGFEFGKRGIGLVLSGLATVILAPVIEEIYFRGFLLPAFSKRSFWLGATISSLFFGLLHFQLNVIIYTFILGLFLAYMYYRLGGIIPGIILHIINNLIAFLLLIG